MKNKAIKSNLLLGVCLFAIGACSPTVAKRGNILEDVQLADVKVQEHTRSDVLRILGSPTTQSTFDPNTWYYIGQETEKRGILDPEVVKERIVIVSFDPDTGFVDTIEDRKPERIAIPYERDKTKTRGNEIGLAEQLLGNLGKYNTNSSGSSATTGGGGNR